MSISLILDCVNQINETQIGSPVGGYSNIVVNQVPVRIHASRYYPRERHTDIMPLLTAIPGQANFSKRFGSGLIYSLTKAPAITIFAFIHNFLAGSGPEDAQRIAEVLIEELVDTYAARPRLQLEIGTKELDVLTSDVTLSNHSDIQSDTEDIAVVSFILNVQYEKKITKVI